MAVPQYAHWEVRTDGHNDNGGCFNPTRSGATKTWDDNYTYGPSYMVVIYDGQTGNEPVLTPNGTALNQVRCDGGRAFVQADVGHVIKITAGTNVTPGRYEITSVSGGVATLDANCWTSTSGGRVFHCLATNCSTVGIQAHVAYACMAVGCGDGFRGYSTGWGTFINCIARNCTGRGFDGNDSRGGAFINCIAYNCGGHGFYVASRSHSAYNCIATNCGQNGFYFAPGDFDVHPMTAMRLAAYNNTSGNWGNLVTTWGGAPAGCARYSPALSLTSLHRRSLTPLTEISG